MKSKKLLDSFVAYCYAHPEQRFWQALRNWCGWSFLFVGKTSIPHVGTYRDTFYWEDNQPS